MRLLSITLLMLITQIAMANESQVFHLEFQHPHKGAWSKKIAAPNAEAALELSAVDCKAKFQSSHFMSEEEILNIVDTCTNPKIKAIRAE